MEPTILDEVREIIFINARTWCFQGHVSKFKLEQVSKLIITQIQSGLFLFRPTTRGTTQALLPKLIFLSLKRHAQPDSETVSTRADKGGSATRESAVRRWLVSNASSPYLKEWWTSNHFCSNHLPGKKGSSAKIRQSIFDWLFRNRGDKTCGQTSCRQKSGKHWRCQMCWAHPCDDVSETKNSIERWTC